MVLLSRLCAHTALVHYFCSIQGDRRDGDGDASEDDVEEEQPPWREAAAALMYEGLAYIERMCSLGSTPERRSLLGSAYKRRAWTGLGPNRTDDLQQAALNYAAAHELEMEEGRAQPSPYARLNQLTLEMLAGDGSERDRCVLSLVRNSL